MGSDEAFLLLVSDYVEDFRKRLDTFDFRFKVAVLVSCLYNELFRSLDQEEFERYLDGITGGMRDAYAEHKERMTSDEKTKTKRGDKPNEQRDKK